MTLPENILLPNEKYKFRLTILCPEPLTEATAKEQRNNITSFYDIVLVTNGPPQTLPLVVSPLNGIPMKTKFKFTTGAAKDSTSDFPLKYTFGYIVNNITVNIGTFYENTVSSTELPFSGEIEIFFKVCDNTGACAKVSGETVASNESHNYTEEEIQFKLSEFDATLKRAEYANSLNVAVVFLMTQHKFVTESSSYETKMLEMLKKELESLKASENSGFIYQQKVVEFIKTSKDLMGLMTVSDEKFVEDLLNLTETINKSAQRSRRATFSKNSVSVVNHDTDYIKNVLGLSEMLLKSNDSSVSQREKGKFVKKVRTFVTSLCQDKNLNTHKIASKFVIFEVLKVYSPQLFIEPQQIPGDDKATILFTKVIYPEKYVCMGKIRFAIDMFTENMSSEPTAVYETMILDNSNLIQANEFSESVTVEIAGDATMTCIMLRGNEWSDECERHQKSNATRVVCKCKTNGNEGVVVK